MIVVSDAGPLIYLGSVGQLALLQDFFGRVVVPQQVWDEVEGDPEPRETIPQEMKALGDAKLLDHAMLLTIPR